MMKLDGPKYKKIKIILSDTQCIFQAVIEPNLKFALGIQSRLNKSV